MYYKRIEKTSILNSVVIQGRSYEFVRKICRDYLVTKYSDINNKLYTGMADGGEHLQRRGARDAGVRAGVRRQRQPRVGAATHTRSIVTATTLPLSVSTQMSVGKHVLLHVFKMYQKIRSF